MSQPTDKETEQESLLEYIIRVSRRMTEIRSLEPLLSYVIEEVLRWVGAERGYIVLLGADNTLNFKVMQDAEGHSLQDGDDQISHSILDEVVNSGQPLLVRNAMAAPGFRQAASVLNLRLRSVMCVPLISRERTIGAIYVENRSASNRFSKEDLSPLEIFANQAAVAIENATLNDELQQAHQMLQKLDEMKSNFILLISHELRTPLTHLLTYSNLIRHEQEVGQDTSYGGNYAEQLETAVIRMRKIIEEIISVVHITSGQLQVRLGPVKLGFIVQSIVNDLAAICAQRQLTLHIDGLNDLPLIMADGKRLKIALSNVIGNAVKYTPDGEEIEISGQVVEGGIELTIADNGIGIPIEEQKRIFDIFHVLGELQHHSTSKHAFRGGGLGLGLPIAKGIIEAHQGTITIKSPGYDLENPPGTTCTIFLPDRPVLEAKDASSPDRISLPFSSGM